MASPSSDLLSQLEEWYLSNVDGDWEHSHGIELGTLDNPGWHLDIDVFDTRLNGLAFQELTLDRTEHDWIRCWVSDSAFHGRCGPGNLSEVIRTFLDWASAQPRANSEEPFSLGDRVLIRRGPLAK